MRSQSHHLRKQADAERQSRVDAALSRLVSRPTQERMDEETLRALEGVADGVCGEGEI